MKRKGEEQGISPGSQRYMKINQHSVKWLAVIRVISIHLLEISTHRTHTETRVVVIPVFPLPALLHMHEAQAMCEAAPCQPGLNGQGRESCRISVCASLLSTLYLSD